MSYYVSSGIEPFSVTQLHHILVSVSSIIAQKPALVTKFAER